MALTWQIELIKKWVAENGVIDTLQEKSKLCFASMLTQAILWRDSDKALLESRKAEVEKMIADAQSELSILTTKIDEKGIKDG